MGGRRAEAEERAAEAREPGAGSGDGAQRERRAGGRLWRSRSHPQTHPGIQARAHTHTCTRRPTGPGRPGARHEGGDPAGRTLLEPAPTSPPLRSAAARLGRRPRPSCQKMVNDRWKTVGTAPQLEDRPRDKPQVCAARLVGTPRVPGGGQSGWRDGHPAPGSSLGSTPPHTHTARLREGRAGTFFSITSREGLNLGFRMGPYPRRREDPLCASNRCPGPAASEGPLVPSATSPLVG